MNSSSKVNNSIGIVWIDVGRKKGLKNILLLDSP